jgi:hypothetical protein
MRLGPSVYFAFFRSVGACHHHVVRRPAASSNWIPPPLIYTLFDQKRQWETRSRVLRFACRLGLWIVMSQSWDQISTMTRGQHKFVSDIEPHTDSCARDLFIDPRISNAWTNVTVLCAEITGHSIGHSRFLKTVKANHRNGPLLIKVFVKPDPGLTVLRTYHSRLNSQLSLFPLQCILISL